MAGEVVKLAQQGPQEQVIHIEVGLIDAGTRLRPVDMARAEGIAASIQKEGLLHPLDICRLPGRTDYLLVCGGHRLEAVKLLGWETVPVFLRSNDAMERLAREVAENLFRADLTPLDRAMFVTRLMQVEKARLGIAPDKDGNALNSRDNSVRKKQMKHDLCIVHKSLGLQQSVAARFGLSQSSVSRDLALNGIAPGLIERVRRLPIGEHAGQLRQLAKLDPGAQTKAVELLEGGKAKSVSDAVAVKDNRPVDTPEKKQLNTFLGTFGRMGAAEKAEALRLLSAQLPKGWKLSEVKPRETLPTNAELRAMVDAQADLDDDTIDIEEALASQGGDA